ncbi:MAG: beta family protein [Pseudomonadota bacterium]
MEIKMRVQRMTVYRPILRFKRGEQTALSNLSDNHKSATKPLLNITAHDFSPPPERTFDSAFDMRIIQDANSLNDAWAGSSAAVDMGDLDPYAQCEGGTHPLRRFFDHLFSSEEKAQGTPVLRLNNDDNYVEAASSICRDYGIPPAFRITPDDLAVPDIKQTIAGLLRRCDTAAKDAELVLDMGYIETTGRSTLTAKGALESVPFAADWSALSLVAGSFPENLSGFPAGSHVIERNEWAVWVANSSVAGRRVLYGDYATIHPILEEGLDPRTMNPTASVRYTHEDTWILLRGQGTRTRGGPGFKQFYDHADTVHDMSEYRGEPFSFGDAKIARIHRREESQGNLETWVTIGVNHHIAEIVDQLANLA